MYPLDLMQEVIGFGYCTYFTLAVEQKIELLVQLAVTKMSNGELQNCNIVT
jgi:hypothetical protein